MAFIVIAFIWYIGWEPINIYGVIGKGVGFTGFALGNYIFSTNAEENLDELMGDQETSSFSLKVDDDV